MSSVKQQTTAIQRMISTKVPKETKRIAHGYLRENYKNAHMYPVDVVLLIAAFINLNDDKWSLTLRGPNIEVDEASASIKYNNKRSAWQTIYGCMQCRRPNVYHWKIKILNIPQNRIFIGVADSAKGDGGLTKICREGIYGFYAVANGGFRCKNGEMNGKYDRPVKNIRIEASDIVEMTLYMDYGSLSYSINGEKKNVMTVYDLPTKNEYSLFVGVYNQHLEIQLLASYCA